MKHLESVRKKLSDRRGASIIISLLVFLLAVLSGTAALTMAASNSGRYTHVREDQQAYLSAMSAAKLVLSRLDGVTVNYRTADPDVEPTASNLNVTFKNGKNDLFLADKRFIDNLSVFSVSGDENTVPVSFILTVPDAPEMGKIYVDTEILGSTFFFRFYCLNGGNRVYQMTMEVNASFYPLEDFRREGGYFYRDLTFDTANAIYTIEQNAPSGGTGE